MALAWAGARSRESMSPVYPPDLRFAKRHFVQAVLALPFLPAFPQPLCGLLYLVVVGAVSRDFQLGNQTAVTLDQLLRLCRV